MPKFEPVLTILKQNDKGFLVFLPYMIGKSPHYKQFKFFPSSWYLSISTVRAPENDIKFAGTHTSVCHNVHEGSIIIVVKIANLHVLLLNVYFGFTSKKTRSHELISITWLLINCKVPTLLAYVLKELFYSLTLKLQ